MDKFDGNWKEFSLQFKTAVGSVNTTMRGYLGEIQKGGNDPDYDTIFADDSVQDIERGAADTYSISASMVTGQALVVLRGVPNGQGWEAWSKLFDRFDPQDSSKVADGHDGCHNTEKGQARERADQRCGGLGGQGKESQDRARHRLGSAHQGGIVDRDVASRLEGLRMESPRTKRCGTGSVSMAVNRVSMSKLVPMEVDNVAAEMWHEEEYHYEGDWEQESQEQLESGYVVGVVREVWRSWSLRPRVLHSQREGERRLEVGSPTVQQREVNREGEVGPRRLQQRQKQRQREGL